MIPKQCIIKLENIELRLGETMKRRALFFFVLTITFNQSINCMENSSENNNADSQNANKVFLDSHECPYNRLARVISQEKNDALGKQTGYFGEHISVLHTFKALHAQVVNKTTHE